MRANQSLYVCESVLANLNAAIDLARAEVAQAKGAESRIAGLLARVSRSCDLGENTTYQRELSSRGAANDNPVQHCEYLSILVLETRASCHERVSA
jgi:hypothetical protein